MTRNLIRVAMAGVAAVVLAVPGMAQTNMTVTSAPTATAGTAPSYIFQQVVSHFYVQTFAPPAQSCLFNAVGCTLPAAFDFRIGFATGSYSLTDAVRANLDQLALALNDPRLVGYRFAIYGHTDASGPAYINDLVSAGRAIVVRNYLVAHGVDTARLEARACGESQLLLPAMPADPRNRRIEVRFVGQLAAVGKECTVAVLEL